MVDETRVLRLLRSLSDDLARLEDESDASADRRADPLWLAGVKLYTNVDVDDHIVTGRLEDLGDLRDFATSVARGLAR